MGIRWGQAQNRAEMIAFRPRESFLRAIQEGYALLLSALVLATCCTLGLLIQIAHLGARFPRFR